jgi:hypothetical protein
MKSILMFAIVALSLATAQAHAGLTINAAEVGIGKFHRLDNQYHPYADNNAWKAFVLAPGSVAKTPIIVDNKDASVTIYFSSLQELFETMVKVSQDKKQAISILNMNAHGMPGGMWYPKSAQQRDSFECADWREAAAAQDDSNYNQYYSEVSKSEIMQYRALANQTGGHYGCVAGLPEYKEIIGKVPAIKTAFAKDAQIHFLSCIVGLGKRGDEFTKGVAALLFNSAEARVESSLMYGLGDWSMPEGMGFWDYQNDEQLDRDNRTYPVERKDRTQMQKGHIRVATAQAGKATSGLLENVDFMFLTQDVRKANTKAKDPSQNSFERVSALPEALTLPGTRIQVKLQ